MAEVAGKAGTVDPLDTSVVADLNVVNKFALGNNDTGTLVTTDKR